MPVLADARAAALGDSVSTIFNQQAQLDRNQFLKVASIIGNDPNFNRKPDYYINVFNIAPVEHVRHRPVDFPTIKIDACPKGEPWALVVRVPNIVNYKWVNPDTGQPSFSSVAGERVATDLINPANLSNNMWQEVSNSDMDQMHGGGDDLSRRGVFWSIRQKSNGPCEQCDGAQICPEHDVPNPEDLRWAKARLERHYREVVQKAEDLARTGKMTEIGAEAHIAANYLHVNSTWHIHTAVQEPCPNCGDQINPGIAYHASSIGGICVLDWPRCVAAGVKKREDVPIELRWWDESDQPQADSDEGHKGPGRPKKS